MGVAESSISGDAFDVLMGSGRIVSGDAHRTGRLGGAISEQDLVSPSWTSFMEESCVGDEQCAGNVGFSGCWPNTTSFFGISLWCLPMERSALLVTLEWVASDEKSMLGRLTGGGHCQRKS